MSSFSFFFFLNQHFLSKILCHNISLKCLSSVSSIISVVINHLEYLNTAFSFVFSKMIIFLKLFCKESLKSSFYHADYPIELIINPVP